MKVLTTKSVCVRVRDKTEKWSQIWEQLIKSLVQMYLGTFLIYGTWYTCYTCVTYYKTSRCSHFCVINFL